MRNEFPVSGPAEVHVELRSGDLTVSTTTQDTVTVEITGSRADSVVVEAEGDRITVVEPRRTGFLAGRGDLRVSLAVPPSSRLGCKLGSASVRAEGELGEARIDTGSGDVILGVVTGAVVVRAGSGNISLATMGADSEIKAGSGSITVERAEGPARLTTGSGSIEVGHTTAPVLLKSGSGDLSVGSAGEDTRLSAASGDLRVGRVAHGVVSAKNVSGNIRLGIPDGTPVWTDISTNTGRVRSTLTPTGAPTEGQSHVEVRVRSVSGDVYLERL